CASINNIILTNYCRFILIRDGKPTNFDFNLFTVDDLKAARFPTTDDKIDTFLRMISSFFEYNLPTVVSAKELASLLSRKAKLLKDLATQQFDSKNDRAR